MEPWTGRTACALQAGLRLSNEAFAAHLGIATRTVAGWHQKPTLKPKSEMQQLLDTALEQAPAAAKDRFNQFLIASPAGPNRDDPTQRLDDDPHITAALDWIDEHTGQPAGMARSAVAELVPQLDPNQLRNRSSSRGRVQQAALASVLERYYQPPCGDAGLYRATFGDLGRATTSVLTRPGWLDLRCPLTPPHDRLTLGPGTAGSPLLSELQADRAMRRLAETLASRTRLVDAPLYHVTGVDIGQGAIGGSVGVTRFTRYALTMDLLESELVDAVAAGSMDTMPLRDAYLPDLDAVLDLPNRLCAGGVLALSAFARPATPYRPADFLLIVQERSGHVLNAARRLAVIPKGFHQPLTDLRHDAQLGVSLRRELEEELFGREDIDCTLGDQKCADPMHHSRLSEPLRWLDDEPGRLVLECTGFGLNLVSGNYEFAALVAVTDDEFWPRFGGRVAANWETSGLRQYSSLDGPLLAELVRDPAWSNEGLFALLQGLRRLAEIDPSRVHLSPITWHLR